MPAPLPETLRLFVALWPEPDVRQALERQQHRWQWPTAARPTPPDKLHVTLHFLGDVAQPLLKDLVTALIAVPPVTLAFELPVAEVWRGGIAVLRPAQVPAALAALHANLTHVLTGLGLPVESRPFVPHVTLARRAAGAMPPAGAPPVAWRSQGHVLVVSRAGRYDILKGCENHLPPGTEPAI